MKKIHTKSSLLLCVFFLTFFNVIKAQPPRVYTLENTGSSCPAPVLPSFNSLPRIDPLTDPFMKSDNSSRSTLFSGWACRRNEIKQEIENYEIGIKPPKPDTITATYTPGTPGNGTLRVFVTRNGQTITLTSQVSLPTAVAGPYPAVIGMNSLSGSVPATVFTNKNIARIQYNHDNVTTYGNPQLTNPFYRLYPEYNLVNAGQYSAWAWGVSRIIDGLELVQSTLPIKLDRLGVTGCSYAGKMALFSGAFDERIALTIAQESGGGGAPSWRVSETLGGVEKLGATDYRWFKDSMIIFQSANVNKLPHDHHELMAMIAPRALLVTANLDFEWLANPSCYVSARAAHEVWKTFGIPDRFGFYIDAGHGHCAVPNSQVPAMQAFVDKFLLDSNNVNTDTIRIHPYPQVDHASWYDWWGKGNPSFDPNPGKRVWLETECGKLGSQWYASSESSGTGVLSAVQTKSGLSSPVNAPANDSSHIVLQFPIDSTASYNMLARISVPINEDYDFWYKLNNGSFQRFNSSVSIPNLDFENGLTGWTTINNQNSAVISATSIPGEARTGVGALKIYNPNNYPGTNRRVRVSSIPFITTKGKAYEISYWVKSTTNASIGLSTGPNEFQYQPAQVTNNTWKQITWRTTAYLDTTTFQFNVGADSTTYFIDDITIREVNAGFGWQWVRIGKANFTKGINTLTITYGNGGGTKIDKVLFATTNSTFSGVGVAGSNCSIQPVNIISFTGVINSNNKVDLEWKTSNEINLSHYSVERYNENNVFAEVGKVNALNSLVNNSYTFGDTSMINASKYQYYRLKLVDAYGQYYYSTILKIAPGGPIKLKVSPNPVRNILIVQHDKAEKGAQLLIYSMEGKLLRTFWPDLQTIETRTDIGQLPPGTYILRFLNNGDKQMFKFSKM